jgi:two-component system, OmpR family, response regulator
MMTGHFTDGCKRFRRGETGSGYILIVDEDEVMRDMLTRHFEKHGLHAIAISGRASLTRQLATSEPCLIVLDLLVDGKDSFDMLTEIRSRSDVPIIVMTAHLLDEVDRVTGLELGADDYLTKPFGARELLARVKAVLRGHEVGLRLARGRASDLRGYRFEGWRLELGARSITNPVGTSISLSKREYALLVAFLEAPQRPLTREQLLYAMRAPDGIFDRNIDVLVLRLRRKLESAPRAARLIQTEAGVGYVFAAAVERVLKPDASSLGDRTRL